MSGPFTPEQETRIAEIVEKLLLGAARQRYLRETGSIDLEMDWARHWAGIARPKKGDDV